MANNDELLDPRTLVWWQDFGNRLIGSVISVLNIRTYKDLSRVTEDQLRQHYCDDYDVSLIQGRLRQFGLKLAA